MATPDLCADEETSVYVNGRIHVFDGATPEQEAIAIRGGRVLAVGHRSEVAAVAGAQTRTVDLDGASMMPGFIDTHPH
jgi:predicted amidohydrolase YtcJ